MAQPAPVRTQAERRASTQHAILDATVETLLEIGYAKTTTNEISRRAGVSHGILFRYWPTKGELLAAASGRLLERLIEGYRRLDRESASELSVKAAVERMWDTHQSREQAARTELLVASRTEPELAAAMANREPHHTDEVLAIARAFLPRFAELRDDFEALAIGVLCSMQGAAILAAANPSNAEGLRACVIHTTVVLLEPLLGPERGPR